MIAQSKVMPTIPVLDLERAKKFYEEKLDLTPMDTGEEGIIFGAGEDSQIYIYEKEQIQPSDHTSAAFLVEDVENEVQQMKEKGVNFEEYDRPDLKTVNNIATSSNGFKTAWFKDSEGNILAITSKT